MVLVCLVRRSFYLKEFLSSDHRPKICLDYVNCYLFALFCEALFGMSKFNENRIDLAVPGPHESDIETRRFMLDNHRHVHFRVDQKKSRIEDIFPLNLKYEFQILIFDFYDMILFKNKYTFIYQLQENEIEDWLTHFSYR